MKLLPIAAAISVALLSSNAISASSPVDFNGYMRGGVGLGAEGGANAKWNEKQVGRLGNENDFYGEFGFTKEVYNDDGVTFKVESMLAFWDNAFGEGNGTNTDVAQFNIQANGLFEDKDITLWAGKRYYQRHDIHITDFYYWNTSGLGAGLEHINMGPGQLSVALLQDGNPSQVTGSYLSQAIDPETGSIITNEDGSRVEVDKTDDVSAFIADVRYAGIPLWDKASLEVGINYNFANEKNKQSVAADDGVMGTAIITQDFDGGFNKTVIQGGNNGYAKQMTGYAAGGGYDRKDDSNNDASGFRIINWGVASLGDNVELGHQALYAMASDVDGTDTDDTAYSLVVRPMYKWNTHMRSILELGVFGDEINNKKSGGSKVTVAQAWSAGNSFWSRPEIRVYASYLNDSENNDTFNGNDSEMSIGVQAEAWW